MKPTAFLFAALCLVPACQSLRQENIDEVQFGLTTAAAIGRASSLAMEAIKGTAVPCAAVKTACTSYPCSTGEVLITLGPACQLPLGGEASGTVTVTGTWQSADEATLSLTFSNVTVASQGNKPLAVAKVTQVSAMRSNLSRIFLWAGANAVASASGTAVAVGAANTWSISVSSKDTPDPNDDQMTVSADDTSPAFSETRDVNIQSALLLASCRKNPTAGSALISGVPGVLNSVTKVQFHSACDGKAEVEELTRELQLLP